MTRYHLVLSVPRRGRGASSSRLSSRERRLAGVLQSESKGNEEVIGRLLCGALAVAGIACTLPTSTTVWGVEETIILCEGGTTVRGRERPDVPPLESSSPSDGDEGDDPLF